MIYEYKCPLCESIFDIEHPMSEVGNPSPETLEKLKCPGLGKCENIKEGEEELSSKIVFQRHYGSCNFMKFDSLSPTEKREVLKKRAAGDYKKNIEERKREMQKVATSNFNKLTE